MWQCAGCVKKKKKKKEEEEEEDVKKKKVVQCGSVRDSVPDIYLPPHRVCCLMTSSNPTGAAPSPSSCNSSSTDQN